MNSVFENVPSFKQSRLQSLFSDFSGLKDINLEGFEANFSAWENLLLQCLREHTFESSIALPAAKLSSTLSSPQYGQPKSLDLVLLILIQRHELVPWSLYKNHSIFLSSYTDFLSPQKLWSKLFTSYDLNRHSPKEARLSCEFYLHFPTLIARALELNRLLVDSVNRHGCYSAGILDFQMFQSYLRKFDPKLSDIDIEAVFLYLSRDTRNIAVKSQGPNKDYLNVLIKVSEEKVIQSEDFEILNLKVNIIKIEDRVALLEKLLYQDIPQRLDHLLSLKAPESRLKTVLRRKSQLSRSLDSASSVANELALLLNKVDDAQSNNNIYQVLNSAKSALSSLNQKVSVSELDDLTSELSNQVALTDEVSDIIGASTQWSEEDISNELALLEREFKLSKDQQKISKDTKSENHLDLDDKVGQDQNSQRNLEPAIETVLNENIKNLSLEDRESNEAELNSEIKPSKIRQREPLVA